ncbi:hypothetical protein BO70DRAFT_429206 [Aspergillus heteromorphus CBS 117.55]|uniref:AA1-like domain-containing protein n=1 Tax=Aspergillus heteromorphus CBS 117.55 TaxID=1448321 RepID=A0A317W6X8_9EURO|nr:uncharacterized protein BO70DRAFT_429206 [Aspergillus heteromorphus CBS 117.55]PWY82143.1 hypothetical protein BO70DRAFT_429206 [Aspergillus heteromorphus CBS 117.55]
MKPTTIATLLATAATAAAAASPVVLPRASGPFQLSDISAQVSTTTNTGSMYLIVVDTNEHDIATGCNVTWTPTPGLTPGTVVPCDYAAYALSFPDGLYADIADIYLVIETTAENILSESANITLDAAASDSPWICGGVEEGVGETKCEYDGFVDVVVGSGV